MTSLDSIENSVYSQNGEDGIIEYLLSCFDHGSYFVEIGCGNGKENNTTNLAVKGWKGAVFDGKEERIRKYKEWNFDVDAYAMKVLPSNVDEILNKIQPEIDLLSIDIDGWDFYVMRELMKSISPKLIACEYNSTFGLEALTIKYPRPKKVNKRIYYGASVTAWKILLDGYDFVTVDSSGNNAFFVRKGLSHDIEGLGYVDSMAFGMTADERLKQIIDLPLEKI